MSCLLDCSARNRDKNAIGNCQAIPACQAEGLVDEASLRRQHALLPRRQLLPEVPALSSYRPSWPSAQSWMISERRSIRTIYLILLVRGFLESAPYLAMGEFLRGIAWGACFLMVPPERKLTIPDDGSLSTEAAPDDGRASGCHIGRQTSYDYCHLEMAEESRDVIMIVVAPQLLK